MYLFQCLLERQFLEELILKQKSSTISQKQMHKTLNDNYFHLVFRGVQVLFNLYKESLFRVRVAKVFRGKAKYLERM